MLLPKAHTPVIWRSKYTLSLIVYYKRDLNVRKMAGIENIHHIKLNTPFNIEILNKGLQYCKEHFHNGLAGLRKQINIKKLQLHHHPIRICDS